MIAQINNIFVRMSLKKTYTRFLSYALYEGRPLTTKGRWINGLVFFFYRVQSVLPFGKKVVKPVFILGTGRSGTTILGITLGIHKDVGFLNEPKAMWSYIYEGEDLIGSYSNQTARYRLDEKDVDKGMIKKIHNILGWYLRLGGALRVVDKYPELIFRTKFVNKIFPDACYLFLYRNGNDTCHSIKLWSERLGVVVENENHDWWGRNDQKWKYLCEQVLAFDPALGSHWKEIYEFDNHVDRAAVEWILTMKEGMLLMSQFPDQVMGVKYEEYVADANVRDEVLQFCALPPDQVFTNYCDTVLKAPREKSGLTLPPVISKEFSRVMSELGYEQ